MDMSTKTNYVELARAAISLLERTELKGAEVQAYIAVNQMLGQIMEGKLEISPPVADCYPPELS